MICLASVMVALVTVFLGGVAGNFAGADEAVYGAEPNPSGDPIGGGKGYSHIVRGGDYSVGTADELLTALASAQAGEVVYVTPDAEIDLSGHVGIKVPDGVTLAGNRGDGAGALGPLLFTTDLPDHQQLFVASSNVRITGVRIRGRDCNFAEINYDEVPRSWTGGIMVVGENVEIDNCEISNFHHSGVLVQGMNVHIHHNFIHDVHAYPVVIADKARPPILIEANLIYWVWHSIAGTGAPGTGYEARYNLIIGGDIPPSWGRRYHCFDMHAYRPMARAGHERIAGDIILIHHNTVREMGTAQAGRIRGIPREIAEIHHNWFSSSDPAQDIQQVGPPCNMWVYDNAYGPDRTVRTIGEQTTARIIFRQPSPPGSELMKVTGELALDFEVQLMEGLEMQSVVVELDGEVLYEEETAPEAGTVVIDTTALDNGVHELTVKVIDNRGVTSVYPRFLQVEN